MKRKDARNDGGRLGRMKPSGERGGSEAKGKQGERSQGNAPRTGNACESIERKPKQREMR